MTVTLDAARSKIKGIGLSTLGNVLERHYCNSLTAGSVQVELN
jgi:hypothetical protein